MATIRENSSFKIKVGSVENDAGLIPEAGALLFDKSQNALVVGDGFNFLPLGGGAAVKDAVALSVATPIIQALVAATPVAPLTFFDTVVYQIGTDIVPTIGDTLTFGATYLIDLSSDWTFISSVPQNQITVEVLIDGTPVATRVINILAAGVGVQVAYLNSLSITAAEVITLRITATKTCNLTINKAHVGIHEV